MFLLRRFRASLLFRNQQVAWVVLGVSLFLTLGAGGLTERYVAHAVNQRFEYQAREIVTALSKRLRESQTVLRSTAGFISASENVTREEWRRFANVMGIEKTNPGMQGVAYIPLVRGDEKARYLDAIHRAGHESFVIWPEGERDLYAPLTFMDPETAINRTGFGFDAYSDPVRRRIMEQARDLGEPAISPRVELAIDSGVKRVGFIFYMPVFANGALLDTVSQRRDAIRGYTLTAFRADVFIEGVGVGDQDKIGVEIYDQPVPSVSSQLYDSHPQDGIVALAPKSLSLLIPLPIQPNTWGVYLYARPEFWTLSERYLPWVIMIGGLVIDVLLFLMVWSLGRNHVRLERFSGELRDQLRASEQVLGSAIETMGEAFVVYGPDDRLLYCNEQYRAIYKISAPVIQIGRTFEEIIRYGAERGQYRLAVDRVEAWVNERMARHLAADSELVQQLEDGRWIRVRERRTETGHIVGMRMDLTEVYQAKEAAEAASRAKSRFLATVSHEIRTPMNGILGMAQILLDPDIAAEKRQEYVRTILRAGQVLLTQLNDILDFSKIEAGKFELSNVRFSPRGLVEEMVKLFMANAFAKQLKLEWGSQLHNQAYFVGDPNRIRQMLSNLLGNAIKFTQQGEVRVEVAELPGDDATALLEFSVSDTGPGIEPDDQSRLFEAFSQVDDSNTRQHGGTGLGLSIVRQLARLMGGDADVESALGQGSRFWFRIRVERSESVVVGGAELIRAPIDQQAPMSLRMTGRALIAEDNETHRYVAISALTRLGLEVLAVEDGMKAVESVRVEAPFDLILLDILMPNLDGLSALKKIQTWYAEQGRAMPPVLAITAEAFAADRESFLAAGMQEVITKPINFDELARILEKYMPSDGSAAEEALKDDFDQAAAMAEIEMLKPLLVEQKFDAFAALSRLKAILAETSLAPQLEQASVLLNKMAFDQALEVITKLADILHGRAMK